MFKSKHSGWTWDLKRTPFGGGGGGFFGGIADSIRGAGDSVGDWTTENGWMIPLAMITAGAGAAYLGAGAAADGGAIALGGETAADGTVFAAGDTIPAGTQLTSSSVAEGTTLSDGATVGSNGQLTGTGVNNYTPVDSSFSSSVGNLNPAVSGDIGANAGTGSSFGTLNPALPSTGSVGGAGAGMSAQLAPGTVLGTGLEGGGAIGTSYAAGANGLPATDFFGNYIPASSMNVGGVPSTVTGTSYNLDTLKQANQVRQGVGTANNLAKLLTQGSMSGLSSSLGKLAAGANPTGTAQLQIVRGNQNPFVYQPQQPIQDTKPAQLASLLKQG